ncbi:MAG: hypothetical protein CM15mV11_2620 [Caudoviricetes sp.]|nr:MAG: hypothetical protein CM15mV11_2620 [Caudoviricetes sp.]
MKNALEGGDGSVGDAALNIRKVLNQADAADKGAKNLILVVISLWIYLAKERTLRLVMLL